MPGIFDGLANLGRMVFIADDLVRVRIGFHHYELQFQPLNPPDPDATVPASLRMDLVNRDSGKPVRGFGTTINAWRLRQFVYALAEGVAATESQWHTIPESFNPDQRV